MARLRALPHKRTKQNPKKVSVHPFAITRAEEVVRQNLRRIEATQELLSQSDKCLADKSD